MEFQLLGSFEARHDGARVVVADRRQERCLLSILLLEAGQVVSTDRLSDLLWDGDASASARRTIHTYVGRIRARLRPYGLHIDTRHGGYVLDPGGHTIDTEDFIALCGHARATADAVQRVRHYDRALALWHGPLLADVADDALRKRLGSRLGELRMSALEQRAEAHLELGEHDKVVADLSPLAPRHPERERLVAAQMTGLRRSGRQAEALDLYRLTRQALVNRLGVEPGTGLRTLYERMLRGDPRLDRPPGPVYAVRVGEEWLPWSTSGHPALEFCNTYAGWGGPPLPGSEWLRSYSTLAVWAGHMDLAEDWVVSGLLKKALQEPNDAAAVLREAREFRTRLYAALTDIDDVRAFKAVAGAAEDAARNSAFVLGEGRLGRWRLSPSAGLRLPVLAVARSAAELLADPARFMIRVCPGEGCGWVFPDESGRRRWCSLRTCGKDVSTVSRSD
ncbi:BTAD domain-containing putative transcriptional regulator [Streptomyces sp. NPDC059499]|uniref:BTAD domain-containing putative transcriptional regulator n=1 Tax=Streptomyces sp. NPDC059499 TaxID=3346852 RepID=UPI00369970EE